MLELVAKSLTQDDPMDSIQVGKAVFVKESYTTLGIEPRTYSYPGRSGNPCSVCWVKKYIEEVQKQLEVVVVVKEEKIKAGRRCSATLKCSAFNPVCEQDGGINKLLAGDAKVGLQFFNAKDWLQ